MTSNRPIFSARSAAAKPWSAHLLLLVGLSLVGTASAQIYKIVDPVTGAVEYTNQPRKGAVRLDPERSTLSEIPTGNRPNRPRSSAQSTEAENPSQQRTVPVSVNRNAGTAVAAVDPSLQKTRDGTRRQVLLEELQNEEKALADVRLQLNGGRPLPMADETPGSPKYIDRVKQLEKALRHHERNVAALKQELANLRL